MDLNPDLPRHAGAGVKPLLQDCSIQWPLPDHRLDVVFTSNFFEHLPDKAALGRTLDEAHRRLKPGGRLIAMGAEHQIPVRRILGILGPFNATYGKCPEGDVGKSRLSGRALPGALSALHHGRRVTIPGFLRLYLRLSLGWRFFGKTVPWSLPGSDGLSGTGRDAAGPGKKGGLL